MSWLVSHVLWLRCACVQAEHRERLQDLQARLSGLLERINAEEQSRQKWTERFTESERDLKAVRDQLRQHSTRRKHLDELCAQLEMAMPPGLVHQQQLQAQQAAVAAAAAAQRAAVAQQEQGGAGVPEGGVVVAPHGQLPPEQVRAVMVTPQGPQVGGVGDAGMNTSNFMLRYGSGCAASRGFRSRGMGGRGSGMMDGVWSTDGECMLCPCFDCTSQVLIGGVCGPLRGGVQPAQHTRPAACDLHFEACMPTR